MLCEFDQLRWTRVIQQRTYIIWSYLLEILFFDPRCNKRSLRCYNIILGKFRLDEYCSCCFCCYLIYVCVGFTCVGMYITTGELTISPSTCCLANQAFISILFTMVMLLHFEDIVCVLQAMTYCKIQNFNGPS